MKRELQEERENNWLVNVLVIGYAKSDGISSDVAAS